MPQAPTATRPRLRADGFALWTAIINFAAVGLLVGLGIAFGTGAGPVHWSMVVPLLYVVASPLVAVSGALGGLFESFTAPRRRAVLGLVLNLVYLLGLGAFVFSMWDTWMSV
jgi:fatty acid desaturase